MSFLSRKSLNFPSPSTHLASPVDDVKPLPSLPPNNTIPVRKLKRKPPPPMSLYEEPQDSSDKQKPNEPQERVTVKAQEPVKENQGKKGVNGQDKNKILWRVSSMFRSKRKASPQTAPSSWGASRAAIGSMYIAQNSGKHRQHDSEDESYDESEDDIRRPSGLGSAVSLAPPPSPSFFQFIKNSPKPHVDHQGSPEADSVRTDSADGAHPLSRIRAVSTPNLLRSISVKAKKSFRRTDRTSRAEAPTQVIAGTFEPLPPEPQTTISDTCTSSGLLFSEEDLQSLVPHLPRSALPSLCPLSRSLCSLGRAALYHRLELDDLEPLKLQKLLATLASRLHLTELVHECVCSTWPGFFASFLSGDLEDDDEAQLRNHFLVATFTLALQRMSNLIALTLPSFNASLLAQHTAFGLRSLTFMCESMSGEELAALFTWLNGQLNIDELRFVNLQDPPITTGNVAPHVLNTTEGPSPTASPWSSPSMSPAPLPAFLANDFAAKVLPSSSSYMALGARTSLFGSSTLLPALTTLQATPAILALLEPVLLPSHPSTPDAHTPRTSYISSTSSTSNGSTVKPKMSRPLQNVSLNITTTLYTGLRPNAVLAGLKGSVKYLEVRFGGDVDRRSVDKFLGAVCTILGAPSDDGAEGWAGLEELKIVFTKQGAIAPSMEETLYKTLQSSIARYASLRKLRLDFTSCRAKAVVASHSFQPAQLAPPLAFPPPKSGPTRRNARPPTASSYKSNLSLEMNILRSDDGGDHHSNSSHGGSVVGVMKPEVFKFPAPPRKHKLEKRAVQAMAPSSFQPSVLPEQQESAPVHDHHAPSSLRGTHSVEGGVDVNATTVAEHSEQQKRVEGWTAVCPTLRSVWIAGYQWDGVDVPKCPLTPAEEFLSTPITHNLSTVSAAETTVELGMPASSDVPPENFGHPLHSLVLPSEHQARKHNPRTESASTIPPPLPPKDRSPISESDATSTPRSPSMSALPPAILPAVISRDAPPPLPPSRASSAASSPTVKSPIADTTVVQTTVPPFRTSLHTLEPPSGHLRTSTSAESLITPTTRSSSFFPKSTSTSTATSPESSPIITPSFKASHSRSQSKNTNLLTVTIASPSVISPSPSPLLTPSSPPPSEADVKAAAGVLAARKKRIDNVRVLARINARDQRWIPKDLPADDHTLDENTEDGGTDEKGKTDVTIQEVLATDPEVEMGLKPPPPPRPLPEGWVKPEPEESQRRAGTETLLGLRPLPEPPSLVQAHAVREACGLTSNAELQVVESGDGHHRHALSMSSQVATEGSESVDYGREYVSYGYGEGFPETSSLAGTTVESLGSAATGAWTSGSSSVSLSVEETEEDGGQMAPDAQQRLVSVGGQRSEFVISRYINSDSDDDGESNESSLREIGGWEGVQRT